MRGRLIWRGLPSARPEVESLRCWLRIQRLWISHPVLDANRRSDCGGRYRHWSAEMNSPTDAALRLLRSPRFVAALTFKHVKRSSGRWAQHACNKLGLVAAF
jgi:hypothetical protein